MKFSNTNKDVALAGLFLSLTIIASLISGTFIPKIPFLSSHIDFWYGIAILGVFFLTNSYMAFIYILSLIFGVSIFEVSSYAGYGDYLLETGIPILSLVMFIPVKNITNRKLKYSLLFFVIITWSIIRLIFMSIGGVVFWQTPWIASMSYNFLNVLFDTLVIVPIVYLTLLKEIV